MYRSASVTSASELPFFTATCNRRMAETVSRLPLSPFKYDNAAAYSDLPPSVDGIGELETEAGIVASTGDFATGVETSTGSGAIEPKTSPVFIAFTRECAGS